MLLRRVDMGIDQRTLCVGAGHSIKAKTALCIIAGRRAVSTGNCKPDLFFKHHIASALDRMRERVRNVGIDVERGATSRPVT